MIKHIFSGLFLFFALNSFYAQVPTATIGIPTLTYCSGKSYTFSCITSNTPTTFSWTVLPSSQASIVTGGDTQNPTIVFNKGTAFTLSLQVSNSFSSSSTSQTLLVSQNATASFNASLNTVGFPNQLILTNYSSNNTGVEWVYSDGPSDFMTNTVKDYTASGNYTVSLIASGLNGCNDTSSYAFRIADSSGITLPNVFTPNNDSVNDVFRPIARGILTMNAWIYSRYGTLIYHWDKPKGYWDGRTSSGEPCQTGVYFCVLEATGFDGRTYKLKTNFTLQR
ncbi:MAG: gliding motility-associated C-terminal domain-containing protein [Sphingobacteriaceae bacterium]|nr:gliding motility-associated C-terminal domain-containing protein [Sphingobacteriaceae bacterium]